MDEKELILFLEAVKESTNNNESDLEEVKSELEVFKSQLMKLSKKYNESIVKQRKQEELIEKMNKERIKLKKELIESNFERKNFESQLNNQVEEVKKLRSELKAKGNMIVVLENSRRKLEVELSKNGSVHSAPCPRMSRSRDGRRSESGGQLRERSYSVDRLDEQNNILGDNCLNRVKVQPIRSQKRNHTNVTSVNDNDGAGTFEKVILLQKLLLSKTRLLTEKRLN